MIAATREVTDAAGLEPGASIAVAQYAARWLKGREALHLASHKDEAARLKNHVLPKLGHLELTEVRPRHIREFVLGLRQGALAPRTVHHVYQVTALVFRTAIAEELIDATPCVLTKGILPKKVDKDPEWRAQAIYTRDEVERIISAQIAAPTVHLRMAGDSREHPSASWGDGGSGTRGEKGMILYAVLSS